VIALHFMLAVLGDKMFIVDNETLRNRIVSLGLLQIAAQCVVSLRILNFWHQLNVYNFFQ